MWGEVSIQLHYCRAERGTSWRGTRVSAPRIAVLAALGLLAVAPAIAQYPGQITKKDKETPALRAVAVLEWTGEPGKPKNSRLVPITVYDGEQLQDGGVYLARPQPLAVDGGVEYILLRNGAKIGLFDVQNAGQVQGSWVGMGSWKPLPSPAPPKPAAQMPIGGIDDEGSDRPVLHRKAHPGEATGGDAGGKSGSGTQAPAPDPDRPTLHKKTEDSSASSPAPAADPDRPVLRKSKEKKTADEGYVESLPSVTDPDRPRLMRGRFAGGGAEAAPTLAGMPSDMEQTVAVSDPRNSPEHPWGYSWAEPADELKMKGALEDIARAALGLQSPAPAPKAKTVRAKARPAPAPPPPAPLDDEVFRVYELAYGSGATLVLTAHTDGTAEQQKFVTLIAQPDLYGGLVVLLKSVTDGAHLDETPRMRLVDAVDALADNRGELLFELRGSSERQFALYRVLRGTTERLFVTGGEEYGRASTE